eukprot:CAMPEP_0201504302 /NCGR_PEP_ID=MMETSP0151_2-20130828/85136_1 /ASSEMBLY_ACC=CAM_ASM_000257 /TAXON_ID=200890 /ORGANISM="Paramoeba atlantica, Strain 621/1 / CCAP 1560/9" /LENGTH=532 /DNA_ID=CAMNT_0047898035 /DNA_START=60 /DNA_END=1658 /DNA_ORIENTATION=-
MADVGYSSWNEFDTGSSSSSWADVADSHNAPNFGDDEDFPELGSAVITKTKKKALRNQQAKEPARPQDSVNLASLPKGARSSATGEDPEPRDQRGRRGDYERQENRRGRRDEDQPSKADEQRDWRNVRKDGADQFSGFSRRDDRDGRDSRDGRDGRDGRDSREGGREGGRDFGSFGREERRGPRPIRGSHATERDFPSAPPYSALLTNIKFEAGEEEVIQFLEQGPCQIKSVQPHLSDGRFKGSCDVEFEDLESMKNAAKLDGEDLMGRSVVVNLPVQESARHERKRLELKPRTLPIEQREAPSQPKVSSGSAPRQEERRAPRNTYQKPESEEPPQRVERKKIELKPRSSDGPSSQSDADAARPSIFGDAKPVDNTKIYIRKEEKQPVASPPAEQAAPKAWGGPRRAPSGDSLSRSGDAPARDAPARDAPARDAPARDAPARDAPRGSSNRGEGNKREGSQGPPSRSQGPPSRSDQSRWGDRSGENRGNRGGQAQQQQAKKERKKSKKADDSASGPKPVQTSQNVFDLLNEE